MGGVLKVRNGEIDVGRALPWAVYDGNGRLLLQQGSVIASQRQLDILLSRGLYRSANNDGPQPTEAEAIKDEASPFEILEQLGHRLSHLFAALDRGEAAAVQRTPKLCAELQQLCDQDADALLGAVHLCHTQAYTVCHPIHTAVLCELVGRRLGMDEQHRISLLSAALTANVSMRKLQETLHKQDGPLTDDQRAAVHRHPQESVDLLQQAGVDDPVWLRAVLEHHEHYDGSGYPHALGPESLCQEGQVLAIADRYAALVSSRAYRKAISAKDALCQFFLKKHQEYDEELALLFIKELSVFPPGCFVRLVNGETAVVVRRPRDAKWPLVSSVLSPRGGPYATPMRRDCNTEDFSIREIYYPERTLPLNLRTLWGYQ